jgi:hypothetical protein
MHKYVKFLQSQPLSYLDHVSIFLRSTCFSKELVKRIEIIETFEMLFFYRSLAHVNFFRYSIHYFYIHLLSTF